MASKLSQSDINCGSSFQMASDLAGIMESGDKIAYPLL